MKIMKFSERIGYIGKGSREKQEMISLGEAYSLWTTLEMRYDALITSKTLFELAKDEDLKKIIKDGIKVLSSQKETLEKLMREFRIPMPSKPPEEANIVIDINTVTDKYIYREIYNGMANFMFKHVSNYQRANGSYLREDFRRFLIQEMDLYDSFFEYGKLKAYLHEEPTFRT
ncbi:DUF3231 family protein [Metallumcola ferriviriculae]|uniref:DUF3231 family protein n=1 Tax=Metallumcola ferriviriculae TaxID=3039180 RepID=A0AAU0UMN8_9FIRM|nr:DUF3231 family protein [Desulfitibacteraceae bacterium MK1]